MDVCDLFFLVDFAYGFKKNFFFGSLPKLSVLFTTKLKVFVLGDTLRERKDQPL